MDETNDDLHAWARAAVRAFLVKLLLANAYELEQAAYALGKR
jgi:hypothetical protein